MNEFIGAYRLLRECGRGAYGVVYLAQSTFTGQRFALKILNGAVESRELEGLIRCRECRHENLIRIHHIDRLPDGRLYYTMDAADDRGTDGVYCPDTLAARGKIPTAELLPILNSLLDAVAALHKRKIIHRDIKPENILFVDGVPVLGDIGLAAPSGDASMVGTPSFLPPEVLSGARAPDAASDLYALGRVAYVALTGFPPHKYPQIPKELSQDAAPVLAFCRAASAGDATLESCRAALNSPPRNSARRYRILLLLLVILAAATAVTLFTVRRGREVSQPPQPVKPVPAPPQVQVEPIPSQSPPAQKTDIPVPRTDAEIDAVLKNTEKELAQRMRQLDRDVAASQARMRAGFRVLTPEEYRTAVAELERRYPVSPELLKRAKARYDAVRKEHFRKLTALSPFSDEGAKARTELEDELRLLEERDALYRLGRQDDALAFSIRSFAATRRGGDLSNLEEMFRERRETAKRLSDAAPAR